LCTATLLAGFAVPTYAAEPPKDKKPSTEQAARIKKLVKQLGADDFEEREAASKAIEKTGKAAVPALRGALKSKDAEVVTRADRLLLRLAPVYVHEKKLRDKDPKARVEGAKSLGGFGARAAPAVPLLMKYLDAKEEPVREAALTALINLAPSMDAITPALLKRIPSANAAISDRISVAATGGLTCSARVVPAMIEYLGHDDHRVRIAAADVLWRIGGKAGAASPALVGQLADARVGKAAFRAMLAIGRPTVPSLCAGLGSRHEEIRSQCALLICKLKFRAASSHAALKTALGTEKSPKIRTEMAVALWLACFDGRGAAQVLAKQLTSGDVKVRRKALVRARTLSPRCLPRALLPALIRALDGGDAEVAFQAVLIMERRLGPDARAAVPRLLRFMGGAGKEIAPAVQSALAAIGTARNEDLAEIEKLLGHANPTVRIAAAEMAWRAGGKATAIAPVLIKELTAHDFGLRRSTIRVLAELGPGASTAVPALVKVVGAKEPQLVCSALAALGNMGPLAKAAAPAIEKALGHQEFQVRQFAALALIRIGGDSSKALAVLVADLSEKKWPVARLAALRLRELGPAARPVVPALAKALSSKDRDVAKEAAFALSRLGPDAREAVPALLAVLDDGKGRIRYHVAEALGAIGPEAKAAVPALGKALHGRRRHQAAMALAGIGEPAIPELVAALKSKKVQTRRVAARALAKMGPEASEALPALRRALNDKDDPMRGNAIRAIYKITGRDREAALRIAQLMARPRPAYQNYVPGVYTLWEMGPKAKPAEDALVKVILARRRQRRYIPDTVAGALAVIGSKKPATIRALILALDEVNSWTYGAAISGLGRAGPAARKAAPRLEKFLKTHETNARVNAAAALWRVTGDPEKALAVLAREIAGPEELGPWWSANSLRDMGPAAAPAVPYLRRAARRTGTRLSSAAALALWKITGSPEEALPALLANLRCSNRDRVQADAVKTVAKLGPAAAAAIPELERLVLRYDDRHDKKANWRARWLRQAAREALKKVRGETREAAK
jgi:HEAT repeat protein